MATIYDNYKLKNFSGHKFLVSNETINRILFMQDAREQYLKQQKSPKKKKKRRWKKRR